MPHYNLYTSATINGQPAPGYSSGQAIAAMEEVAAEVLPEGFGYEWTGTTYQEQKTGNMATYIFALSIVCVFLFMAALYESWIRPLVIILTVPLAMLRRDRRPLALRHAAGRLRPDRPGHADRPGDQERDPDRRVRRELREKHGMSIIDSAKEASRQRLRPILMTSFAFVFGVLPMAVATGAGAAARQVMGTTVVFGMLPATLIGIILPSGVLRADAAPRRALAPAAGHAWCR